MTRRAHKCWLLTDPMSLTGFLILLFSLFYCSLGHVYHAKMPSEIQGLTGSCLEIPCTFTSPRTLSEPDGIWRSNHYWTGVDVFKESQSLGNWSGLKVTIIGDLKQMNCTTQLDGIRLEDQGVYYFRIEGYYYYHYHTHPFRYSFTDGVHINVKDSPDRPLLTAGSPVKEGESTSLRCSAPFLCPKQPPSLAWSDTLNGTVHQTVDTGIKENRSVSSLLTFTTSYHLHMKDITCTVSYTVETEKRSAAQSLTLSVLYAPRETSIHHTDQIFMGQSLTLTCNASANPTANFSWFQINGASASLIGQQQEVTLVAVTPGDSGRYYCQAENLYGKDNSKPVILNVLFPPNNTTASLNYTTGIKDGDPVALICSSSANPLARYSWFKITEAAILLMGSERSLTLTAVTPSDSGRYYCQAQNSLGLENSTFVFLNVLADTKTENISFLISGICVTVVVVILVVLCVVVNSKRRSATSSTDHSPVTSAQNMKHVTPTHAFTAVYVNSQAIRNQMEEEEQDDNTQYVYIDFQRPKNVKDRTNLEESSAMTRRPPEDETLYADIKH